ncbi:hypothetical protein J7T55_014002 [Diaporthe amygdali]|uniref:uncharacterized protein n=1 Tax=Phomopsis amygdali TaxID=1214568 RepID=UPI0022FEA8A6|nr:uncharacterized protein J7T55_014002 [Diaporthe amygdali]KAJ0119798.1 hypothetical protein J7T55_014002 [Diaporthe amygdali]
MGTLPTRVIDVGSESVPPRLYITNEELVPYVALSYCWGTDQNIRLLSSNIAEYTDCLPLDTLPQTMRDAVTITRKMGLRFLWIDALCILQDSEDDLRHEIGYMRNIYANAWFTIAAKDATTCFDGCFTTREWPCSAVVPLDLHIQRVRKGIQDLDYGRKWESSKASFGNRLMALPLLKDSRRSRQTPILETRGWTLQEEMLSRRILSCGKDELSWTCLESSSTESNPIDHDPTDDIRWRHVVRRAIVTSRLSNDAQDTDMFVYWLKLVEEFSQRRLSNAGDKLAALSGVQEAFGALLGDAPEDRIGNSRRSLDGRFGNGVGNTNGKYDASKSGAATRAPGSLLQAPS